MRANTQPALCVRCQRNIAPGEGRFVGPGRVLHNAPCKPFRKPSTKKMLQLGRDFLAPAALAIVTVMAAAAAGTGDYELRLPAERICATSAETCETARRAIRDGRWPIAAPETPTECRPSPGCFSAASECIASFNCR